MEEHEIGEAWKTYILGQLYAKRPRTLDLGREEIAAATGVSPNEDEDEFFDDVIDGLIDDGLVSLRNSERAEGVVFSARLTAAGQSAVERGRSERGGMVRDGAAPPMKTREFRDRLLVALYTAASGSDLGAYLDAQKVADEAGLVRPEGLLRITVDDLERNGYVKALKLLAGGLNLRLTSSGVETAEELLEEHPEYAAPVTAGVPAADRYVQLNDNQRGELGGDLEALRLAVRSANDVADEDRQIALSEIAVFEAAVMQPRLAQGLIDRFVDRIIKWIVSKFGEALLAAVTGALVLKLMPFLAT